MSRNGKGALLVALWDFSIACFAPGVCVQIMVASSLPGIYIPAHSSHCTDYHCITLVQLHVNLE